MEFTKPKKVAEMAVDFVSDDVDRHRRDKAMAKICAFFDKLYLENPEVRNVAWSRHIPGED